MKDDILDLCTIDGCFNSHVAKGYCRKHYSRVRRYGNPHTVKRGKQEKHGMCGTPEYKSWESMKRRCYTSSSIGYRNYGGRGIIVCEKWKHSFIAFFKDMGYKPFPEAELDRIDNEGNYELSNCEWVSHTRNNQHTSRTKLSISIAMEIRRMSKEGVRNRDIASELGVSELGVSQVINNYTWVSEV